jgi:hypothetical protein
MGVITVFFQKAVFKAADIMCRLEFLDENNRFD